MLIVILGVKLDMAGGNIILEIREIKGISRKELTYGLCTEKMLGEIENNSKEADQLLLDILLQRLGKSPDRIESILTIEEYNRIRVRDLLERAILRGNKALVYRIMQDYPCKTKADDMYTLRMKAWAARRIDNDRKAAIQLLEKAVEMTLPGFDYKNINSFRISTMELENLLELERLQKLEMHTDIKEHLQIIEGYVEKYFDDGEEYAKIYSKCMYLLAQCFYEEDDYLETELLSIKGVKALTRHTMLHLLPELLELIAASQEKRGLARESNKWAKYSEVIHDLETYHPLKYPPKGEIFHNCSQKEYHLDYELIRNERESQNMTQAEMSEGIYKNEATYSRFETGKTITKQANFEKMMKKIGVEKERYNGLLNTESFELLELNGKIGYYLGCCDYIKVQESLNKLKEKLDLNIAENQRIVRCYEMVVEREYGKISIEDALRQEKELLENVIDFGNNRLSHIPLQNEIVLINSMCLDLRRLKRDAEAKQFYEMTAKIMENSRVKVKHRHRSYIIILLNCVNCSELKDKAFKVLEYELLCDKASVFPYCLVNIAKKIEMETGNSKKFMPWAEKVYYMSDLFKFEEGRSTYGKYLMDNNVKILV